MGGLKRGRCEVLQWEPSEGKGPEKDKGFGGQQRAEDSFLGRSPREKLQTAFLAGEVGRGGLGLRCEDAGLRVELRGQESPRDTVPPSGPRNNNKAVEMVTARPGEKLLWSGAAFPIVLRIHVV